jgi:hypothetical protein
MKYSSPFCTLFCLEWDEIIVKTNYSYAMNYYEFQKRVRYLNAASHTLFMSFLH